MQRKRLRDYGINIGQLKPGINNAITDVCGVRVGHETIAFESAKTGVTIILPHPGDLFMSKTRAAVYAINGYGKACGFEQVRELGVIESPIALTNTFNVGLVSDAIIQLMIEKNPKIGCSDSHLSMNVVVGETNDGMLNDMQARHVRFAHVKSAYDKAESSGDFAAVEEGCVGAGTGTTAFGFKGGIGSASRKLSEKFGGFTIGVLVQTNFGSCENLIIGGFPVGRHLCTARKESNAEVEKGSVMVVLATDAPLSERQLERLAKRVTVGLARTGSMVGHGSGDFVIAFSTKNKVNHLPENIIGEIDCLLDEGRVIPHLFQAVIDSTEEAVINSLFMAKTTIGRNGWTRNALPIEEVIRILSYFDAPI